MKGLLVILERKEFEERLAGYLAGRPLDEQRQFLVRHGVRVDTTWNDSQLRQEISNVLCAQTDLALGAEAQSLLMGREHSA